ncbi:MAG: FAD-dependent monooxygenase [Bacteroidota bacterium]
MKSVLIIGAGPVGLVMAAELARHGITSRIIDRLTAPSPFCRALGITPRTLEVWEDMGISREAIDAGIWLDRLHVEVEGFAPQDFNDDLSDIPFATLCLPQNETERILTAHLLRFGITVERGVSLEMLTQDAEGVTVTLDHNNEKKEEAAFRYVIGCDGAHSKVRKLAGIDFEGESFPFEFMLADVRIDWDLPKGKSFQAIRPVQDSAPDFFVAVPLPQPNRYRVSMLAAPELKKDTAETGTEHGIQSERPAPALDHFQAIANRLVTQPARLSDIKWSSIFRISTRLATRYREGHVFIAGDAAHIHPPTGGQGMNTGIQDAYNLAWKMALVLKDAAPESLLDSYNAERREVGMNIIENTLKASLNKDANGFRSGRLSDTQILLSYRNSEWVSHEEIQITGANTLQAGDRAPDCTGLRRKGVGFPFRLFDILQGTQHVLIIDVSHNEEQAIEELSAWALHTDLPASFIRIVAIGQLSTINIAGIGISYIYDPEGTFAGVYGSTSGAAWLVRPDGYIGWCSQRWQSPGITEYLEKIFGTVSLVQS